MATVDATTSMDTESDKTTTAVTEDTSSTVLMGFSEIITKMLSLYADSAANDDVRKTNAASVIGKLTIMDEAIVALHAPPTLLLLQLRSDMAELAFKYLPEDTRKTLEVNGSGDHVAMVLVRRSLTQLPVLAKTLYKATPDALDADEGLKFLHSELSSSLELYGALVDRGVNPRKRPWAKQLTDNLSSLLELKWMSWRRLMHDVGMSVTLGLEEHPDSEESEEVEQASPEGSNPQQQESSKLNDVTDEANQAKNEQAAALAAAHPAAHVAPALTKGEVQVLECLYSTGSNVPQIRKQALDFGLGLDAAGQLEDANITTSSKLTESSIRTFQSRLKVPGKSESDIKSALMAMLSNRPPTTAASPMAIKDDDDDDQFFGSYDTNEELIAAAGGGIALYGVNFFPNANDVTLKPYAPIMKKPTFVEMAGASASFEASVLHTTEQSMASTFTKTTENGGISIARASSTSWGVSASVSGLGGAVGASASADCSKKQDSKDDSKATNAFSSNNKKSTTSATMVEVITCPMKSFRIPVSAMTMSEEALDSALEVDTLLKASQFLDTFGSHVSNGRHLLGGIFFRTMTMTSESEVETSTLLAAASTQMQQSKTASSDVAASISGGGMGVSAKASSSMKSASSSGVVTFNSTAGQSDRKSSDSRAMFQTYVQSMGPNVATPELFADVLLTDTSSWTVIDRGPFEALLPITNVLENMLSLYDAASSGKSQLENAINLLTVAWQQRAALWKHLEDDPAVPTSLRHMIGRSFAAEDAHDEIRAAVIDLFDVIELADEANTEEAAEALSAAVIGTAKQMEHKPAGRADFFETLTSNIGRLAPGIPGKYHFKEGSPQFTKAVRSAKKLSSTDWCGFDLIWQKRLGHVALKDALDNYLKFEQATLRFGERVAVDEPLVSINEKYRLELSGRSLQIVDADSGAVEATLFVAEGTLGHRASAHMDETGAFVLDLTMITGFDRTETKVVLWTAPNTESTKGGYARMQNDGKFVVFNSKGKMLWST